MKIGTLRHKIAKILIPKTYRLIESLNYKKVKTPRPFTNVLKKYYGDKPLIGTELGVFQGENSQSLLKELNIEKLYLIDVWDLLDSKNTHSDWELSHLDFLEINSAYSIYLPGKNQNNFKTASERYNYVLKLFSANDNVVIIKDYSEKAVNSFAEDSLDFVYIDANHSYNAVFKDLSLWMEKVKQNGFIGGHDTQLLDVLQAVIDYSIENNCDLHINHPDWWIRKEK